MRVELRLAYLGSSLVEDDLDISDCTVRLYTHSIIAAVTNQNPNKSCENMTLSLSENMTNFRRFCPAVNFRETGEAKVNEQAFTYPSFRSYFRPNATRTSQARCLRPVSCVRCVWLETAPYERPLIAASYVHNQTPAVIDLLLYI